LLLKGTGSAAFSKIYTFQIVIYFEIVIVTGLFEIECSNNFMTFDVQIAVLLFFSDFATAFT